MLYFVKLKLGLTWVEAVRCNWSFFPPIFFPSCSCRFWMLLWVWCRFFWACVSLLNLRIKVDFFFCMNFKVWEIALHKYIRIVICVCILQSICADLQSRVWSALLELSGATVIRTRPFFPNSSPRQPCSRCGLLMSWRGCAGAPLMISGPSCPARCSLPARGTRWNARPAASPTPRRLVCNQILAEVQKDRPSQRNPIVGLKSWIMHLPRNTVLVIYTSVLFPV